MAKSQELQQITPFIPTLISCTMWSDKISLKLGMLVVLHSQHEIKKDQQIHNLLATYHTIHKHSDESISNFTHRFCETQHSLEKLIPGIHTTADGNELMH